MNQFQGKELEVWASFVKSLLANGGFTPEQITLTADYLTSEWIKRREGD